VKTTYYHVHDFLNFQINNKGNLLQRSLGTAGISFKNFEHDQKPEQPDFSIEIGPFNEKKSGCRILDDNFHVRHNYVFFEGRRKFATWKIEIEDLETNPIIRINPNLAASVTQPLHIIEFFIQYCLLKKGISVIHASGLSKNGHVFLLPGTSGGGKTTISLSLVERGYRYLGDNYIILHKGSAYSYLTPLNIFSYNRVPIVENSLSTDQRISLMIRQLIFDMTRGYIKIFMKINPKSVFRNQYDDHGTITDLCFLEPSDEFDTKPSAPRPINSDEAASKLRYNMELEWLSFIRLMCSYGYLYPDSLLGNFWSQVEFFLLKNLYNNIRLWSIGVPSTYHSNVKNAVVDSIHNLHSGTCG